MAKHCFHCKTQNTKNISNLYGFEVCSDCMPKLGLLTDNTIQKHVLAYRKAQLDVPENPSYKEEVDFRLASMEQDYIKKRLKLLHIQARIRELE